MTDPKVSIKNLIKDNWDADNVSGITPVTHLGWYDTRSNMPQITITDTSEVVEAGGVSGYTGMTSGGTPAQLWVGSMSVNCWTTREATKDEGVNPKRLIFEMREEIKRIVKAKYDDATDLFYIAWKGGMEMVDTGQSPVVYRWIGEVGYAYLD